MTAQEPDDAKGPGFHKIIAAARAQPGKPGGAQHSPLYEWLWAHYSDMASELNPPRTPNWVALAKQFGALGVFDGKGQVPRPITVRQTWSKVNRDKEVVAAGGLPRRRRGKGSALAPVLAVERIERPANQAQPTTPTPAQPSPGIETVEPAPPEGRYQFRLAGGVKKWTNTEPEQE